MSHERPGSSGRLPTAGDASLADDGEDLVQALIDSAEEYVAWRAALLQQVELEHGPSGRAEAVRDDGVMFSGPYARIEESRRWNRMGLATCSTAVQSAVTRPDGKVTLVSRRDAFERAVGYSNGALVEASLNLCLELARSSRASGINAASILRLCDALLKHPDVFPPAIAYLAMLRCHDIGSQEAAGQARPSSANLVSSSVAMLRVSDVDVVQSSFDVVDALPSRLECLKRALDAQPHEPQLWFVAERVLDRTGSEVFVHGGRRYTRKDCLVEAAKGGFGDVCSALWTNLGALLGPSESLRLMLPAAAKPSLGSRPSLASAGSRSGSTMPALDAAVGATTPMAPELAAAQADTSTFVASKLSCYERAVAMDPTCPVSTLGLAMSLPAQGADAGRQRLLLVDCCRLLSQRDAASRATYYDHGLLLATVFFSLSQVLGVDVVRIPAAALPTCQHSMRIAQVIPDLCGTVEAALPSDVDCRAVDAALRCYEILQRMPLQSRSVMAEASLELLLKSFQLAAGHASAAGPVNSMSPITSPPFWLPQKKVSADGVESPVPMAYVDCAVQLVQRWPTDSDAHVALAKALMHACQPEPGRASSTTLDPVTLRSTNAFDCAVRAAELDANNGEAWMLLTEMLAERETVMINGETIDLVEASVCAVSLDASRLAAWLCIGRLFDHRKTVELRSGEIINLEAYCVHVLNLDPTHRDTLLRLAGVLGETGGTAVLKDGQQLTARACVVRCLSRHPEHPPAWTALSRSLTPAESATIEGRTFTQVDATARSLDFVPHSWTQWLLLGVVLSAAADTTVVEGEAVDASAAFARALQHAPAAAVSGPLAANQTSPFPQASVWMALGRHLHRHKTTTRLKGTTVTPASCFEMALKLDPANKIAQEWKDATSAA